MTTATATATRDFTLYDADAYEAPEAFGEIMRDLAERYIEQDTFDSGEEPEDYEAAIRHEIDVMDHWAVREEIEWHLEADLECAIDEVERQVGDGTVIFTGLLGLWNGIHRGGGTADSFADAIHKLQGRDCEVQAIEVVGGEVHVTLAHHDGINSFTVRALTDAGWDAHNDWTGWEGPLAGLSDAEAYEALMTSDTYSHSIAPEW